MKYNIFKNNNAKWKFTSGLAKEGVKLENFKFHYNPLRALLKSERKFTMC